MEAQVHKVIEVGHVELKPVDWSVQIDLETVANYVESLLLFYDVGHIGDFTFHLFGSLFSGEIIGACEQVWKSFQKEFTDSHVILLLFPGVEPMLIILQLIRRHL